MNSSFHMECNDCMDALYDESGELVRHTTQRGVNMAAYSRGWFVSPAEEDVHFCPSCRIGVGV